MPLCQLQALVTFFIVDTMFSHLVLWLYICVDTKTHKVPAQN